MPGILNVPLAEDEQAALSLSGDFSFFEINPQYAPVPGKHCTFCVPEYKVDELRGRFVLIAHC